MLDTDWHRGASLDTFCWTRNHIARRGGVDHEFTQYWQEMFLSSHLVAVLALTFSLVTRIDDAIRPVHRETGHIRDVQCFYKTLYSIL